MNEHSEEHHDPDMEFTRPEDHDEGQDYYAAQEGETEYADPAEELPEKPKSNLLINVAIFGGVGIFALIMAWVNFGSVLFPKNDTAVVNAPSNSAALLSPVVTPAVNPAAQPTVVPAPTPTDATAAPAPGAPTDVAALSVTPGAPVTPPPATTNPTSATAPTVIPAPSTATAPITTVPLTPTTSPAVAAATSPVMPTAAMVSPQPAAAPPVDNNQLMALQQQNQDLTAKNADQETAINDLKSQLADAQAKLADAEAKLAQAQAAAAAPKPTKKVAAKKPAAPVHHAAAKPAAPVNDNQAAASSSGYLGDTLPAPPPYWVLRSAADNSAWVAHPGDSQLYQVTVGDQLPGIGKITSIQQQAGAWVVVGTQGQIRQP